MDRTLTMLKYLESAFPDRCPNTSMTDRDIWIYAGKVQLIQLIRYKLEEAQEKLPEVLGKGD